MSDEHGATPEEILARNITALNNRDMEAYLANQHPEVEFTLPGNVTVRGREQVRAGTQVMWDAFPDGRLAFGRQVLGVDAAATEVIFTGTHTGPLVTSAGTIPATGRCVRTASVSMLTFQDGLVASERIYGDEVFTQLGITSPDAGTPKAQTHPSARA